MLKKVLIFALAAALVLQPFIVPAFAVPSNSAHAAILVHQDTGTALFKQNADERMLVASTTKIMTALVVLENCDVDETVVIKPEYTGIEGSSMYLKAGTKYSVLDLLYGMMLVSGNDAATALAYHTGGDIEGFAELMNEKCSELGLVNTCFKNPHGLDEDGHYSTARDLATITAAAMENEIFCRITSEKFYTTNEVTYRNHNKLLWREESVTGGKTGYTMAAGRILVSSAERDGLRLICVTISDPDDWDDHLAFFSWAFDNYSYSSLLSKTDLMTIHVISGVSDSVGVSPAEDLTLLMDKSKEYLLRVKLPGFVFAKLNRGEIAGQITVTCDGETAGEVDLIFNESVDKDKSMRLTLFEQMKRAWAIMLRQSPVSYGYY